MNSFRGYVCWKDQRIEPVLNPDALQNLIGQRNVLYKSDKIDITSEAVTALDARYKSGGK